MAIGNKDFDPTQMMRANEAIRARKEQVVAASEFDAGAVLSDQIEGGQKFQASIGESGELSLTAKGGAAPAVNVINWTGVPTKGGGAIIPSNQAGSSFRGAPSASEGVQAKIDLTKMMDQIEALSTTDPEQAKILSGQLNGMVVTAQQQLMKQYQDTAFTEFGVAIQQQAVNMEGAVDADVRLQNPGMEGSSPNFDRASRQLASAQQRADAAAQRNFSQDSAWTALAMRADNIVKQGGLTSVEAVAKARSATVIIKGDITSQTKWNQLGDGEKLAINTVAEAWGLSINPEQPHKVLSDMEPSQQQYVATRITNPDHAKALVYAQGDPLQEAAEQAELGFERATGASEQEATARVGTYQKLGLGLTKLESTVNPSTSAEGLAEILRKIDPALQNAESSPMWEPYQAAAKQVKTGDAESKKRGLLVLAGARNALIQDLITRNAHADMASGTMTTPLLRQVPPANEQLLEVFNIQQVSGGFPSPIKTALQYLSNISAGADLSNINDKSVLEQRAAAQEVQKWFQQFAKQNNENSGMLAIDAGAMYREVLTQQLDLNAFYTVEDQIAKSALLPLLNRLGG